MSFIDLVDLDGAALRVNIDHILYFKPGAEANTTVLYLTNGTSLTVASSFDEVGELQFFEQMYTLKHQEIDE
jgi:uncharacterized protein YlzI (FlbEa/FlbD family)